MADEIKVGDWVVAVDGNESFRVVGFATSEFAGPMLVDKWGGAHTARSFRKYNGAVSALEAAEAATEKMLIGGEQ